jgi:thiol:disulfide interchange protein DsbA
MKRRDFSLAATSLGLLPLAATPLAHAQSAFKAGTDYLALKRPAPVDAPAGKVEVVEFFSYNCPHCAQFEPALEAWVKKLPPHVAFRRVPVPFVGNDPATKQRLYYTLEMMGAVDALQMKVFQAIHAERQPLFGDDAVKAWALKQPGLDGKKFTELFDANSFSGKVIAGKIARATELTNLYAVGGVPALGVAGRYYVDGELARSMDRALQITDFLVTEARKA